MDRVLVYPINAFDNCCICPADRLGLDRCLVALDTCLVPPDSLEEAPDKCLAAGSDKSAATSAWREPGRRVWCSRAVAQLAVADPLRREMPAH